MNISITNQYGDSLNTDHPNRTDIYPPMSWVTTVITSESFTLIAVSTILVIGGAFLVAAVIPPLVVCFSSFAMCLVALVLPFFLQDSHIPRGINGDHFTHSLRFGGDSIYIPEGCDLDTIDVRSLLDLVDEMNILVPFEQSGNIRPNDIDSSSKCVVQGSEGSMSYCSVRKNIEKLIHQVIQHEVILGVPRDRLNTEAFYVKIEMFLKVIIYEIQSRKHNASICNEVILQCASIVGNCGARYMAVLSEEHEKLVSRVVTSSFKDIVLEAFHKLRKIIVTHMTYAHQYGATVMQPHILNGHMINLGCVRGIRGSENLMFNDTFDMEIDQNDSIHEFDRIYTPEYIQERFEEMVNGIQIKEGDGDLFNSPRFINIDPVVEKQKAIGWLGEHVPPEWNPSIQSATGSMELTLEQVEALFGPSFDEEQRLKAKNNAQYQQLTGSVRLDAIRALMFQIACTTIVGNVKSVGCTYILQQLGVLNGGIDWTEFHIDMDVLSDIFSYDSTDLNRAQIDFSGT